jgi:hypothetical protein
VIEAQAVFLVVVEVPLHVAVEEGVALLDRKDLGGQLGQERRHAGGLRSALRFG